MVKGYTCMMHFIPRLCIIVIYLRPATIVRLLDKVLILEYKYGPPEGYLPVVDYVLNYLREVIFN